MGHRNSFKPGDHVRLLDGDQDMEVVGLSTEPGKEGMYVCFWFNRFNSAEKLQSSFPGDQLVLVKRPRTEA
jgi:uncharacterized protein YodC (DUF2158 family)